MGRTKYGNFEEVLSNKVNRLAQFTLEGKWKEVEEMYNENPACHTAKIDDFVGTALHVVVDLAEEKLVEKLVKAIIRHKTRKALKVKNYQGDTALHVAASRGFTKICQIIVGENRKRIYLAKLKNKDGYSEMSISELELVSLLRVVYQVEDFDKIEEELKNREQSEGRDWVSEKSLTWRVVV